MTDLKKLAKVGISLVNALDEAFSDNVVTPAELATLREALAAAEARIHQLEGENKALKQKQSRLEAALRG